MGTKRTSTGHPCLLLARSHSYSHTLTPFSTCLYTCIYVRMYVCISCYTSPSIFFHNSHIFFILTPPQTPHPHIHTLTRTHTQSHTSLPTPSGSGRVFQTLSVCVCVCVCMCLHRFDRHHCISTPSRKLIRARP